MKISGKSKGCDNTGKRLYIRTFGCQMNVRDSKVIAGLLMKQGYQLVANKSQADILIYNTCSVRQHAEEKVWSELGKLKVVPPKFAKANLSRGDARPTAKKKIIGLAGCMAQNYKDGVFRRAPQVDFVVGPSDIHKIPDILDRLGKKGLRILETDGNARPEQIYHTGFYEDKNHAYVVISEGCSNFCSYCVVPYVRGALKNRNHQDIIKEIERAIDKGITDVTLLGQNVSAYGAGTKNQSTETGENINFIKLLELVNQIKGLRQY